MKLKEKTGVVIVLIVLAALSRLLPHYPNFTAVGAVALFGGAYLAKRLAYIAPFVALFVSDLLLNNLIYARQFPEYYEGFVFFHKSSIPVYIAFAVVIFFGSYLLKKVNATRVLGGAFGASLIFFIITNFGVWAQGMMYPKTLAGLVLCFEAAIPFFWNTLASTAMFSVMMFGAYEYIKSRQQNSVPATTEQQ